MTTYTIANLTERLDEDFRITIKPSITKPLAMDAYEGIITITDRETGDVYVADVLDYHDCYEQGGEASFVWAEVR